MRVDPKKPDSEDFNVLRRANKLQIRHTDKCKGEMTWSRCVIACRRGICARKSEMLTGLRANLTDDIAAKVKEI